MHDAHSLKDLLNAVFKERGIDFSQYREELIKRRIETRLRATGCTSFETYLLILRDNEKEMDALLDALTINVTQFFRDPQVFQAIKEKIFPLVFTPEVFQKKKTVHIWSLGCSSGEEPFTLLMLIAELFKEKGQQAPLYIYGTDIDRLSLEKARKGIYEKYVFQNMPQELQDTYFTNMGEGEFVRKKEWDQYMLFKWHDIIREGPLCNMDVVICRNVFIYFTRELQELCLKKIWQALNKGGFLVLGLTESLWNVPGFTEFDRQNRIYRKI